MNGYGSLVQVALFSTSPYQIPVMPLVVVLAGAAIAELALRRPVLRRHLVVLP